MSAYLPGVGDRIDSSESEGAFNEYIEEQLSNMIDGIITDGDLTELGDRGTDLIVEMDDIKPPTFTYGEESQGGGGGGRGPARRDAAPGPDRGTDRAR